MGSDGNYFDRQAERGLLGALMLRPETLGELADISDSTFYDERHSVIFGAMRQIASAGDDFSDIGRLHVELQKISRRRNDPSLADLVYLSELLDLHPSPTNVPTYAERLCDLAGKRALYSEALALLTRLEGGECDHLPADIIRDEFVQHLRGKIQTPPHLQTKSVWTAAELLSTQFPDLQWIARDLLPVGLSWLAGRPKLGKSWLALQIAVAVGSGGILFGGKVARGRVLFLAFEDSGRRLRDRLRKQHADSSADITFVTAWPVFGDGGLSRLKDAIARHGYRLVVVDTFSRAAGMADQRDPALMTSLVGELQAVAQSEDSALLVIDHHRKSTGFSPDPIDDILESTAKGAVIDTAWGLYKERGRQGATLMITGRDIEERELSLVWDPLSFCWQYQGDAGEVRDNTLKGQILGAIQDLETLGELATQTTIAQHLSKDQGNVGHALADLLNEGRITKCDKRGRSQPYRAVHT